MRSLPKSRTFRREPSDTPVLRSVARRAGLSHVALSTAKTKLRDAGLIDERGRAIHALGEANGFATRAATICVAPIPFAADHRYRIAGTEHLIAHPLYIALAIARDRTRGPEILAAWNPTGPEGFRRSW